MVYFVTGEKFNLPLREAHNRDGILTEDYEPYIYNNYFSQSQSNLNESQKHIEKEVRLEKDSLEDKSETEELDDSVNSNEEQKSVEDKELEKGGYYVAYRKSKKPGKFFLQYL